MSLNFISFFEFTSLVNFCADNDKFIRLNLKNVRAAGPLILNLKNKESEVAGQEFIFSITTSSIVLDFSAHHLVGIFSTTSLLTTTSILVNYTDSVKGELFLTTSLFSEIYLNHIQGASGTLDITTTVSGSFTALHANGILSATTSISSNILALYIAGITGVLDTTTANTTSVFSAHSTIYGTFDKVLPNVLTTNITLKFIWFFTTIDINTERSLIAQFLLAQDPNISFNLENLTTSIDVVGTVPLRYFVTIFSYTYPLIVSPPITGIVYPAGNIDLKNTNITSISIFGRVPEPIEVSLNLLLSNSAFTCSAVALIGINLIPFTNTFLTRFFVRVDLPINVTLSSTFYCSLTFYGHTQNHGSLSSELTTLFTTIRILVPIYIQGTLTFNLTDFIQNPWIGRIESCGTLASSLYESLIKFVGICQIQGTLSKSIPEIVFLFYLERKDTNSGILSITNLLTSTNIYIHGHSLLHFDATLPNTLVSYFSGLNTKIGVILDINNNSFTGPVFKCTAYIQGVLGTSYPKQTSKYWRLRIFSNCGNASITTFDQIKLYAKDETGETYEVFKDVDPSFCKSSGYTAINGLDSGNLWVASNEDFLNEPDGMYWQFVLPEKTEIISYDIIGME